MNSTNRERAALNAALSHLDCKCSDTQKELFIEHLHLLMNKNEELNLTRVINFEDACLLHVADSISILEDFSHAGGRFCDIGTGGGFPGIPLGIMSGREGVLLDSVKKKAKAVQEFVEELGLENQLKAVGRRSEELAVDEPESFDTVVVRAVSSLNVIEELAAPLLRYKGRLVAMKGKESPEDEKIALNASEVLGFELLYSKKIELGSKGIYRSVYVFEKSGEPSIKLPRRPGVANKKPFGI